MDSFEDQLSLYLKGQMTEAEEQEFLAALAENPALSERATAIARLARAMCQVGSEMDHHLTDAIRGLSPAMAKEIAASACSGSELMPEESAASESGGSSLTLKGIAIFAAAAAVLLCIVVGGGIFSSPSPTPTVELGEEYLACFPAPEYTRGTSDAASYLIQKLYADLEEKNNLDTATAMLADLWDQSRSDTYNDYTEHMPAIGWLLANAYLLRGDTASASDVLRVLIAQYPAGTAMGDKSRELLAKIQQQ